MNATPTHQALQPEYRLLVLLVSIGFFMQALDTTIVNTAIPAMAHHLNEDPLRMHSVVVAYVLSVAACIPLSGWLADRFGVRNTFLSAIVIFTLASLGCGLSQSLNELLFFRVIQGVGGGIITPRWSFITFKNYSPNSVPSCHESYESGRFTWSFGWSHTRGLAR